MSKLGPRNYWHRTLSLISVLASVLLGAACSAMASSSVILAWDPNPEPDIAGYKIFSGTSSGDYGETNDVGNVVTTTLTGLTTGVTYYFAATAYNTSGLESDFSNEISFTPTSSDTNHPPVILLSSSLDAQKQVSTPVTTLSVSDSDAGDALITFNLVVEYGSLAISSSVGGGVTAGQIAGNGTAILTINASLAAFNSTVNAPTGLLYTGGLNFIGTDTLTVTVNDNGNVGSNGPQTDSASMEILVTGNAYDEWLNQSFSQSDLSNPSNESSLWGELADPDGDGQSNLLEFAVGSNPGLIELDEKSIFTGVEDISGQKYFAITFTKRKNQSLLQYIPEVSPDQVLWSSSLSDVFQSKVVNVSDDFEVVTFQDLTPITVDGPRFIRLRVVMN